MFNYSLEHHLYGNGDKVWKNWWSLSSLERHNQLSFFFKVRLSVFVTKWGSKITKLQLKMWALKGSQYSVSLSTLMGDGGVGGHGLLDKSGSEKIAGYRRKQWSFRVPHKHRMLQDGMKIDCKAQQHEMSPAYRWHILARMSCSSVMARHTALMAFSA